MKREQMKDEAIKRLKILDIEENAIQQFINSDIVMSSEHQRIGSQSIGVLYWLNDEQKRIAKEIEERYSGLVYAVVHSFTSFGIMDAFLYVSKYDDEWEEERELMNEDGYAFAYVYNYTMPDCSEFGDVIVKKAFGGLIRIA